MKKKLLASVLALSLTLGLCSTAFAATDDITAVNGGATVEVTTKLNIPTIAVTIAPMAEVIINPFNLEFDVENETAFTEQGTLLSTPSLITSTSQVGLTVEAIPTGTITGDATFATSSVADRQEKSVFMFLQLRNDLTSNDPQDNNWKTVADYNASNSDIAIVAPTGNTAKATMTLDPIDGTHPEIYGAYQLIGDSSYAVDKPWGASDSIGVNIAFTFTPIMATT